MWNKGKGRGHWEVDKNEITRRTKRMAEGTRQGQIVTDKTANWEFTRLADEWHATGLKQRRLAGKPSVHDPLVAEGLIN